MTSSNICDYLIVDLTNVLYRSFFSNKDETEDTIVGLAIHMGLVTLNKYYKQYKPSQHLVLAFDRSSWRKVYTASDLCLSKKPYKGNRRANMSPSQREKFKKFIEHLKEFEELISNHTTIKVLVGDLLEADDLIAGFVQKYNTVNNVVISTDSDLMQLLKFPNVRVISPATDKPQSLEKYNNDAEYYLFQKIIRGDLQTDNIPAAFPRVRSTRIEKAYTDPFERIQLLKETWINENKVEFLVEDLFEENNLLINLESQPPNIREKMSSIIEKEMNNHKKFSLFHLLKFLKKHELTKISESIDIYMPMLSK